MSTLVKRCLRIMTAATVSVMIVQHAYCQLAGISDGNDLVIAPHQQPVTVVASPMAGPTEKSAAADLAKYVTRMCGKTIAITQTEAEVAEALQNTKNHVLLIVGQAALKANPALQKTVHRVAKTNPELRADAIVLKRKGNRIYITGNHDEAHYYAVSRLLQLWGCRWYIPGTIGECVRNMPNCASGNLTKHTPPLSKYADIGSRGMVHQVMLINFAFVTS